MGIAIRSTEVPRWCVAAGEGPREATESLRSIQVQAGAARPGGMHGERGAVAPRRGEERAAGPGRQLLLLRGARPVRRRRRGRGAHARRLRHRPDGNAAARG